MSKKSDPLYVPVNTREDDTVGLLRTIDEVQVDEGETNVTSPEDNNCDGGVRVVDMVGLIRNGLHARRCASRRRSTAIIHVLLTVVLASFLRSTLAFERTDGFQGELEDTAHEGPGASRSSVANETAALGCAWGIPCPPAAQAVVDVVSDPHGAAEDAANLAGDGLNSAVDAAAAGATFLYDQGTAAASAAAAAATELASAGFEFAKGAATSAYAMGCSAAAMAWNTATAVYDRMSDPEKFLSDMIDSFPTSLGDLKSLSGKALAVGGEAFVEMNANNPVGRQALAAVKKANEIGGKYGFENLQKFTAVGASLTNRVIPGGGIIFEAVDVVGETAQDAVDTAILIVESMLNALECKVSPVDVMEVIQKVVIEQISSWNAFAKMFEEKKGTDFFYKLDHVICNTLWTVAMPHADLMVTAIGILLEKVQATCPGVIPADSKPAATLGLIFDASVKGGSMKGVSAEVGIGADIDGNKFCYFGSCAYAGISFGGYGADGTMLAGLSVWKSMDSVPGTSSTFAFAADITMPLLPSFDPGVTFVSNDAGLIGISVSKEIPGGDEPSGEFSVTKGRCVTPVCVKTDGNPCGEGQAAWSDVGSHATAAVEAIKTDECIVAGAGVIEQNGGISVSREIRLPASGVNLLADAEANPTGMKNFKPSSVRIPEGKFLLAFTGGDEAFKGSETVIRSYKSKLDNRLYSMTSFVVSDIAAEFHEEAPKSVGPEHAGSISKCKAMCAVKKHCCNTDESIGSNQYLSCLQACVVRVRGTDERTCNSYCASATTSRHINGYMYNLATSCADVVASEGKLCSTRYGSDRSTCLYGCSIGRDPEQSLAVVKSTGFYMQLPAAHVTPRSTNNLRDRTLSSVIVRAGFVVKLYAGRDLKGQYLTLGSSATLYGNHARFYSSLRESFPNTKFAWANFNDRTRSIAILEAPVTLYTQPNFHGDHESKLEHAFDYTSLGPTVGDRHVNSIFLREGSVVEVYEGRSFNGRGMQFISSVSDIRRATESIGDLSRPTWQRVYGTASMVDAGREEVYSIHADDVANTKPVDNSGDWSDFLTLKWSHISVGPTGHVWAMRKPYGNAYHCMPHQTSCKTKWEYTRLTQLDAGSLYVWGVTYSGYVYRHLVNTHEGSWTRVNAPDTMKHISIGPSGDVWAVSTTNKVYFCVHPCTGSWRVIGASAPVKRLIFTVNNDKYMARVDLKTDGSINFNAGHKVAGWLSLSGITYATSGLNYLSLNSRYWEHYSGMNGYWSPAQYSCSNGLVSVTGLVKTKNHGWGQVIGTLPSGCRPTKALIFTTNNHDEQARVNVYADGTIKWGAGGKGHGWLSLSNIVFSTSGNALLPLSNGWAHYSGTSGYWSPAEYSCADGLVVLSGLVRGSNWGSTIGTLPPGCRPKQALIFTTNNSDKQARVNVSPGGLIKWSRGGKGHGWLSLSGIVFAMTGLQLMPLSNGWKYYNGARTSGYWAPAQVASVRGLTVAQGLIKGGGWGGTMAKITGGCGYMSDLMSLTKKTAGQHSTAHNGVASRPLTSTPNGRWGGGTCTHTNYASDPWWRLDMGTTRTLSSVELLNRNDCCSDRFIGLRVYISNHNSYVKDHPSNKQCGQTLGSPNTAWNIFDCGDAISGRYVYATLYGKAAPLTICGVRMFESNAMIKQLDVGKRYVYGTSTNGHLFKIRADGGEDNWSLVHRYSEFGGIDANYVSVSPHSEQSSFLWVTNQANEIYRQSIGIQISSMRVASAIVTAYKGVGFTGDSLPLTSGFYNFKTLEADSDAGFKLTNLRAFVRSIKSIRIHPDYEVELRGYNQARAVVTSSTMGVHDFHKLDTEGKEHEENIDGATRFPRPSGVSRKSTFMPIEATTLGTWIQTRTANVYVMSDLSATPSALIRYIAAYGDAEYCKMIMFHVRHGDEVSVVPEEAGYATFGIRDASSDKCQNRDDVLSLWRIKQTPRLARRATDAGYGIGKLKFSIVGGWTGEIASMKVMRKLTYVQGYSGGRHRNEGGNPKRTPRECRDIAKSKGLPAWGFRTGRHNDPNWRFTCFFYEHGFGRFAGNDDTMHMTGCVDISRKTANGCALSASASARLGSEDLETYPRAMARPKARLLESDWYYISVCCVLVSLASVVAFVAFRRSRTSGKRILLERVSTNYGATI